MNRAARKMRQCARVCVATIVASLAIVAADVLAQSQSTDERSTQGRDLYQSFQCWQCHGYEAQGGAAARIAGTEYTYEAFARFVRHPNLMPAYPPRLLSDEKLRLIYEFVRSIPEPPPIKDIPALRNK